MNKDMKLNSPRTLEVCRTNGVLPEELYYIEYKDYLSVHPEISSLPEDIKKYRFNLLERLRLKTIKMVREKRYELIGKEKKIFLDNKNFNKDFEFTRKKWTQNNSTFNSEYLTGNMTFSERISNLMSKEKENIDKLKSKQKQKIEFMIENQMKSELINYKILEKDKKVK